MKIFNVGLPKTGTTSLNDALAIVLSSKIRICHTSAPLTSLDEVELFARAPYVTRGSQGIDKTEGNTSLHDMARRCTALSDVPWWALAPALLRHFDGAETYFIMTTWSGGGGDPALGGGGDPSALGGGCRKWFRHFSGLHDWAMANLKKSAWDRNGAIEWHACVFGHQRPSPASQAAYVKLCVEHEARIVRMAAALGRRLLVLPVEWDDKRKWAALLSFLRLHGSSARTELRGKWDRYWRMRAQLVMDRGVAWPYVLTPTASARNRTSASIEDALSEYGVGPGLPK